MPIDFLRSDEERSILARVQTVVDETIAPSAQAIDEGGRFPFESFAALRAAGLLGLAVHREYGGLGCGLHGNILVEIMAVEELARGCSSTSQVFHNHNGCIGILYYLASAEQQQRFSREIVTDGALHVIWGGETGKTAYDIRATATALDVTSRIFQIMGARAAGKRRNNLDRYWRNVRTFTLHDPIDWKRHTIGKYLLEGTPPPVGWY
jgi:alkylation response protein AidB-like acyl-CoA dehydrogenase